MDHTPKIRFRSKIITLVAGIFCLAVAYLIEFAIFDLKEDGRDGIIAMILINLFFILPIAFLGIYNIWFYFANGKKLKRIVKQYGKENIIANIKNATIKIYENPILGHKVYFTDRLVADTGEAIFGYNEVSLMYKHVTKSQNVRTVTIAFALLDGSTYFLCDHADDEEIRSIIQLCRQHNPSILIGYTKENRAVHKQKVKSYKKGKK